MSIKALDDIVNVIVNAYVLGGGGLEIKDRNFHSDSTLPKVEKEIDIDTVAPSRTRVQLKR